jgi:arylsulfatase A-like enzyme
MLWLAAVGALATAAPPSIIFILSDDCELSYPRILVRSRHCSYEHQHHGKLFNKRTAFRALTLTHCTPRALAVGYGDYSLATEVNQSSFRIPTPNIERLAENGVRFSRGYSMQVCAPSRYLSC